MSEKLLELLDTVCLTGASNRWVVVDLNERGDILTVAPLRNGRVCHSGWMEVPRQDLIHHDHFIRKELEMITGLRLRNDGSVELIKEEKP